MNITVTEIMDLADMHAHAKITEGTPAEMMPRNLLQHRMQQICTDVFVLQCKLVEARREIASLQAQLEAVGAVPDGMTHREFGQFLSDVLTAAGLVSHGGQSKGLGQRLADAVMRLRAAPQPPAQAQEDARKQDDELILRLLEALEHHREQTRPIFRTDEAITAARARLAATP